MIDNINILLMVIVSVIALLTPKESEYSVVNNILCAKFWIFIGAYYVTLDLGFTAGIFEDIYRACLDIVFMSVFLWFGGRLLAFISLNMAIYHLTNIFYPTDYFMIMGGFQILQILIALGGMIDGLHSRHIRYLPNHNHHQGSL